VEFFADRDLGRYEFPGSLRSAGIVVHAHADHFPQNTPDVEWLPEAARRGWVILTNDRKIRSRALELQAVMTSGARVLALVGGSLPAAELARNFINTAAKVEEFVAEHPAPWIARLYRPSPVEGVAQGRAGSIKLIITLEDWQRRGP
jgi:predicted nuclease of predicted toxin-antitoxin system